MNPITAATPAAAVHPEWLKDPSFLCPETLKLLKTSRWQESGIRSRESPASVTRQVCLARRQPIVTEFFILLNGQLLVPGGCVAPAARA
ncbi:hypothetical protein O3P69_014044 [Scylla paramamosain]|uniref:Uncharacterized protein n=1 Tax=Scylla paramamosain TaxID=85552 RepID=A0AAW0SSQ4_SCYPA